MKWEMFSEKLSKNNRTVIIFCDREDIRSDFVEQKKKYYEKKRIPVVVRLARPK